MQKIYETTTVVDAELVRVLLRKHKIKSFVEGIDAGLRGPATPISIYVAPADAEAAVKAIQSRSRKPKKKPAAKRKPAKRKKA